MMKAVKVFCDGGTDGNSTEPASYTYRMESFDGEIKQSNVPLAMPRPIGKRIPAPPNSIGRIIRTKDGWKLYDCGEVPAMGVCQ